MLKSNIGRLRLVGLLEGISFLLLIGICVPLKYIWDMPEPTKVIGMAHGVLFIAYCILLLDCKLKYQWSFLTALWAFIAALLPFGTFVADARIFRQVEA